jgi:hypothetical protein
VKVYVNSCIGDYRMMVFKRVPQLTMLDGKSTFEEKHKLAQEEGADN